MIVAVRAEDLPLLHQEVNTHHHLHIVKVDEIFHENDLVLLPFLIFIDLNTLMILEIEIVTVTVTNRYHLLEGIQQCQWTLIQEDQDQGILPRYHHNLDISLHPLLLIWLGIAKGRGKEIGKENVRGLDILVLLLVISMMIILVEEVVGGLIILDLHLLEIGVMEEEALQLEEGEDMIEIAIGEEGMYHPRLHLEIGYHLQTIGGILEVLRHLRHLRLCRSGKEIVRGRGIERGIDRIGILPHHRIYHPPEIAIMDEVSIYLLSRNTLFIFVLQIPIHLMIELMLHHLAIMTEVYLHLHLHHPTLVLANVV